MAMGEGWWLNPTNDKIFSVGTTHNDWIRNPNNATLIGLPADIYEGIMRIPADKVDDIRTICVMAGLVRIRDYKNSCSVQYFNERHRNTTILWSVLLALHQVGIHKYTDLRIENLRDREVAQLNLDDLKRKLENDEPIMRESDESGEHIIQDIPMDHPAVVAARKRFADYVAEKEAKT